ncbi:MAG: aminodeoxychorismate synthase component I [bacterium]|nr:aminodeoxychorismate synthase component I [bacterium]
MKPLSATTLRQFVGEPGTLLLRQVSDTSESGWLLFHHPQQILQTERIDEVVPYLQSIDEILSHGQNAVAGIVAYETAPAFDNALQVQDRKPGMPLLWYGVYDEPLPVSDVMIHTATQSDCETGSWTAELSEQAYREKIVTARENIAAGESYQINLTFRMQTPFSGDPFALFQKLYRAQPGAYSAFVNLGEYAVLSVSPELFFEKTASKIRCKPMKGTILRGRYPEEDRAFRTQLSASEKDRAENVMIVDMVRNDLGRIAKTGTVQVPALFEIEPLPHVWQMTSTVTAETNEPLSTVFRALFPCASITGAPKIRTTQLITALEQSPRGVYTGAIGFALTDQFVQFNVAIRTVTIDKRANIAEFGVGGGIVWDSTPEGEYQECLDKANFLFDETPQFSLLETLRWSPRYGYFLWERHLERMRQSARYFGFPFPEQQFRAQLQEAATQFPPTSHLVRIQLHETGVMQHEATALHPKNIRETWRVKLALEPIDERDKFYFHKTTNRQPYRKFVSQFPDCDDVLLWNSREELTEATKANLVIRSNGKYYTPPIACGLLAGTYRKELLSRGILAEKIITRDDLRTADRIYLINSVRGWIRVVLL